MIRRGAAALDGAAILAGGIALGLLLLGPYRLVAFGTPGTVRWTHALFVCLALLAVRHAAVPRPPVATTAPAWFGWLGGRPNLRDALLVSVVTRPPVLAVGFAAVVTFGVLPSSDEPAASRHALRDLPARFDANWYAGIALEGYHWQGTFQRQQNIAFFPAYPMLMRAAGTVTGAIDPDLPRSRQIVRLAWTGLAISWLAFIAAAWYFARLARDILGDARARDAVVLLAAYPFAVFFSAAYTESLFLLAALGAWHHARQEQFARAGAWALLLGLTRPNGFFLGLPLGLMALGLRDGPPAVREPGALPLPGFVRRVSWAAVVVAVLPAIGMLFHTIWLYRHSGVWFAWARVQVAWGRVVGAAAPDDLLAELSTRGLLQLVAEHPYQSLNAIGFIFALSLIGPVWRRLGPAWVAYVLVNVVPPLFAGGLLSMGRLTSTLFPLFLAFTAVLPPRWVPAVAAVSGLFQGLVAALFYTWREMY